jgi:methylthioribose-1-phosphate isomerase
VLAKLADGNDAVLAEALEILDEDERLNRSASAHACEIVLEVCDRRPLRLLSHCNAGHLATVAWGSALGVVWHLHERGLVESVLVDETRPLLQGARLTAWELETASIPHAVIADSAAGSLMAAGEVDCVITGADRIAANGDTANKIGTYSLAVLARHHELPLYIVAPSTTVDLQTPDGSAIPIEERDAAEITERFAARNPAFDVTPAELIEAIVTEAGVHRAPYEHSLTRAVLA